MTAERIGGAIVFATIGAYALAIWAGLVPTMLLTIVVLGGMLAGTLMVSSETERKLRRRSDTAVALWKQAETDNAALADEVKRLRAGLPRDVFVDLNFERVLRGESTVGQLDEDSESWSWPGDLA